MNSIKKDRFDLAILIAGAALLILAVILILFIMYDESNDPMQDTLADGNMTAWTQERAEFQDCLDQFMDTYRDVDHYECTAPGDVEGTTKQWDSKSPTEVCSNDCTPIFYPKWDCSSEWDRPDFTSINAILDASRFNASDAFWDSMGLDAFSVQTVQEYGPAFHIVSVKVPVNHDGFANWTWPAPYGGGIWLNVTNEQLADIYVRLMIQNKTYRNLSSVTCGYRDRAYGQSEGNLTGEVCSCDDASMTTCGVPGAGYELTRNDNYLCCVRLADSINEGSLSRNFCVAQDGVTNRIICSCEAVVS